mmetsp:Transcript_144714/g.251012  ORF Transcript_144714/g.251012 Transcript_144714/m.251012 type:complete len:106 (+) Transcript_144714:855-1172(+)
MLLPSCIPSQSQSTASSLNDDTVDTCWLAAEGTTPATLALGAVSRKPDKNRILKQALSTYPRVHARQAFEASAIVQTLTRKATSGEAASQRGGRAEAENEFDRVN